MPLDSSRHVCRRKRERTEPELCQCLDVSFAQASGRPACCVPRTVLPLTPWVPSGGWLVRSRVSPFC